ncbi:MAG: hypothetical protein ACKV22_09290 [Bryobacteraceae bacterium]
MGRPLAWLVRLFSYLFHTVLGSFLCVLALVAILSGKHNLRVDLLPWEGKLLTGSLAVLGLYALFSVVTAVTGKTRVFLILQSVGIVVLLVRGIFLTSMPLDGNPLDVSSALALTGSALLALVGSFLRAGRRHR